MTLDFWSILGFTAQILFTGRVIIQWVASERAKKSVAPPAFWWMSLVAACFMIFYSFVRTVDKTLQTPNALPILVGTIVTLAPYIRNLMLSYHVKKKWHILSYFASGAILIICIIILANSKITVIRTKWFFLGTAGSLIWFSRFLLQWYFAEKNKKSYFPLSFWYLSLSGITLLIIYTLAMKDPVYILGYIFNVIPIIRNIILIHRSENIKNNQEKKCLNSH
jgi:lipid-A-disaccharide synthase-like uncharacterized protein